MANIKKTYTLAEAQAAIDNSNGQQLPKKGQQPSQDFGDPEKRSAYNATGKRLGHEYMHRGHIPEYPSSPTALTELDSNRLQKSRVENRATSYRLACHLLNSPQGQKALDDADKQPENTQKWLKLIPVTSKNLYGYDPKSKGDIPKRITHGAINFRKIKGTLFIAPVYPTQFMGERDYDLSFLTGEEDDSYNLSSLFGEPTA
jgi:hypothetical protein